MIRFATLASQPTLPLVIGLSWFHLAKGQVGRQGLCASSSSFDSFYYNHKVHRCAKNHIVFLLVRRALSVVTSPKQLTFILPSKFEKVEIQGSCSFPSPTISASIPCMGTAFWELIVLIGGGGGRWGIGFPRMFFSPTKQ